MKSEQVLEYTAVIEKDGDVFSVYFPDVPGCFTQGDTLEEARAMAHEALEFHLDGLRQLGKPIPQPGASTEAVRVKAS